MNQDDIQNQEELSFEEFYKIHVEDALYYARKTVAVSDEDAKDIVSEAFLLLLESWKKIEPKTYVVLVSWMRKTVLFQIYNQNRKKLKISTIPLDEIKNLQTQFSFMKPDLTELIKNNLTSDEYQLFSDIVIQEKPCSRVAKKMNIQTDVLYVRWFRLKKKIQNILERNGYGYGENNESSDRK